MIRPLKIPLLQSPYKCFVRSLEDSRLTHVTLENGSHIVVFVCNYDVDDDDDDDDEDYDD